MGKEVVKVDMSDLVDWIGLRLLEDCKHTLTPIGQSAEPFVRMVGLRHMQQGVELAVDLVFLYRPQLSLRVNHFPVLDAQLAEGGVAPLHSFLKTQFAHSIRTCGMKVVCYGQSP